MQPIQIEDFKSPANDGSEWPWDRRFRFLEQYRLELRGITSKLDRSFFTTNQVVTGATSPKQIIATSIDDQ